MQLDDVERLLIGRGELVGSSHVASKVPISKVSRPEACPDTVH